MPRIKIKPLSVNEAWQGRRFKTPEYRAYEKELLFTLPKMAIPPPPYEVIYRFGFSSMSSDLLNPEKPLTDVLCKKYGFNDKHIYRMTLEKCFVPLGQEFFEFTITHFEV